MDEMRLESKFTTVIASKLAEKLVRDNRLRTTVLEDKMHVELNVDLELTKEELDKLLKSVGL